MMAAMKRGHQSQMFSKAAEVSVDGYVMARLHQWAPRIWTEREELLVLQKRPGMKFVQDRTQIDVYEDKINQHALFNQWMPRTYVHLNKKAALGRAEMLRYPLISKSSIGSASLNVRLLKTKDEAIREVEVAFGGGLKITKGIQAGYVYWQEFIPHDYTWRVAIVGTKFHVYKRFNYDDRPMAAPSKVKPTQPVEMNVEVESLLAWSKKLFETIGTKWCAIDVLQDPITWQWLLLETSLAWARGRDAAGLAPFYGTKHNLMTQHTLLIEEIEAGVFG
jgi:glutathione synthase/RimK-type ligase-like ATP-grasp enzyme